jgi:hypothetical protein
MDMIRKACATRPHPLLSLVSTHVVVVAEIASPVVVVDKGAQQR